MDISIIIPVKNEFVYLSNLVKSIQNQKFDGKIEILVGIDNSKEIIDKIKTSSTLFSNCKFYMFDDNVGPYIIKNTLATLASSNNLFMFDVDDIMTQNLISTSINLLENFHMVKVKYEFFSQTYTYKSKDVNNYSTLAFGAFAIRKSDFLSLNGFQPWFISADIEFIERAKRKIRSGANNLAIFGKRIHNNSLRKSSEHGVGSDYYDVKNQELSKKRKNNNFENPNTLHTHACKLLDYTNPTKEKFNETHLVFSPEEIFKNLIEGKRVVFIGPATTLENNGMGAFIDSFDVIVRMNSSYMIPAKSQIDYGSRCDILYAGNVFLKLNLLTPDNSQHIKLICSTKNYPVFSGKNRKFSIFRLKNQKRLLTGIYAIEDILNMNPSELHITGIDFYQSEKLYTDFYKIKKLHENEIAKTTINKYHDVEHDLKYFKKNIANKANVTLDETLKWIIETGNKIEVNVISKINNQHSSANNKKTIHFAIPTYNRPDDLLNLIKNIDGYSDKFIIKLFIYNDSSDLNYDKVIDYLAKTQMSYVYTTTKIRLGKENYSEMYNLIFRDVKNSSFDYFIQTADDMLLVNNFFNRAIDYIKKTNLDVLNILMTSHHLYSYKSKNILPTNMNGVNVYQYVIDGAYIAKKIFFGRIDYKINSVRKNRWDKNKLYGSGTGHEIKKKYKGSLYQLSESLFIHTGHESVMNPDLRKVEKMESIVTHVDDIMVNEKNKMLHFKNYVKNKRVVLVGPSPDITDNGEDFGKFIDDFDVIVRTNGAYPINKNNEKYHGSKTDVILLNNAYCSNENFNIDLYDNSDISFIFNFGKLKNKLSKKFILEFDNDIIKLIQNRIEVEEVQPFGGMYLIEQILKFDPKELFVCGFSNYENKTHYDGYLPNNIRENDVKIRQEKYHKYTVAHQKKYIQTLLVSNTINIDKISKNHF